MIGETIVLGMILIGAYHLVWSFQFRRNKRKARKELMALTADEIQDIAENAKRAMKDRSLTHEERADAQTIYRLCQQVGMMARSQKGRVEPTIGSLATDNAKPKKTPSLEGGFEPDFRTTEERVFDDEEIPAKQDWAQYDEPTYLRNDRDRHLH